MHINNKYLSVRPTGFTQLGFCECGVNNCTEIMLKSSAVRIVPSVVVFA